MSRALVTPNRRHALAERGDDAYWTPYAAVAALLVAEGRRLPHRLWEPACGAGAIVNPLRNRGREIFASDLNDWGLPGAAVADFLTCERKIGAEGIVTNPPFKDAEAFIERACAFSHYVAIFARFQFLESEGRLNWFEALGLRRVHLIGERLPMMHRVGWEGPKIGNSAQAFAWFIFEPQKKRARGFAGRWVSWKAAVRRFPMTDADLPVDATGDERLPLFAEAAE